MATETVPLLRASSSATVLTVTSVWKCVNRVLQTVEGSVVYESAGKVSVKPYETTFNHREL